MAQLAMAVALAAFSVPALAQPARVVSATLAERATAFTSLAECEQSLEPAAGQAQLNPGAMRDGSRGSLFNRAQGNSSRCELIDGEPQVVVIPKAS